MAALGHTHIDSMLGIVVLKYLSYIWKVMDLASDCLSSGGPLELKLTQGDESFLPHFLGLYLIF